MPATAKEKYSEFKKKYEEARKQLNEQAASAFQEFASEVFEKYPGLESFGWTQYTPYFNDGDECVFSVNASYTDGIYINGEREGYRDEVRCSKCNKSLEQKSKRYYYDSDPIPQFCPSCGTPVVTPESAMSPDQKGTARKDIVAMMSNFEDDILRDLYGDHCKVTVLRTGTATVDEYEHD